MALINKDGNYVKITAIRVSDKLNLVVSSFKDENSRKEPDAYTHQINQNVEIEIEKEELDQLLTQAYNLLKKQEGYQNMEDA